MTSTSISTPISTSTAMADLSPVKKLLLLLCNATSLFQLLAVAAIVLTMRHLPWLCTGMVVIFLYLLPPLLCRLVLALFPIRQQIIPVGTGEFFVWWFALNVQMVFCRFPFLEEILRVIPSCYSMWLRLWGAKVGKLTYWAAGTRILDRQALQIGDNVTFGADVRINPHVILKNREGQTVLVFAPVKIGDRVSVGGYSLLVAGSEIASDESTSAFLILPPFNRWESGKRHKPADSSLVVED